jgi:hypothetical protein
VFFLFLAPNVPLGAPFRKAPLDGDNYPEPIPTHANLSDAKRNFALVRAQAELGHEEIGSQNPMTPIKLPLTDPRATMLKWILGQIRNELSGNENRRNKETASIHPPYCGQRDNGWDGSMGMPIFKVFFNAQPLSKLVGQRASG